MKENKFNSASGKGAGSHAGSSLSKKRQNTEINNTNFLPPNQEQIDEFVHPPKVFLFMESGPITRIVVSVNTFFAGNPKYDFRMWFKGEHDGKWRASKKGVTLPPELYEEFQNLCFNFGIHADSLGA